MLVEYLGMQWKWVNEWNAYISTLTRASTRLNEEDDTPVWTWNKYTCIVNAKDA